MKIIRMKAKKEINKADMFAVLCLVQSALVILTVVMLYMFSRINREEFLAIRKDIEVIFDEDLDIGGYFTPSEEKEGTLLPGTLSAAAYENKEYEKLYSDEEQSEEYAELSEDTPVMPVSGKITSDYGQRVHPVYSDSSFHEGRDIAAVRGTPIHAVADGCVIASGTAEKAGNYIKLQHADGSQTLYCHCEELFVSEGIYVRRGEVIASVGDSGLATGPHLHFEYHINGRAEDPALILDKAEDVY